MIRYEFLVDSSRLFYSCMYIYLDDVAIRILHVLCKEFWDRLSATNSRSIPMWRHRIFLKSFRCKLLFAHSNYFMTQTKFRYRWRIDVKMVINKPYLRLPLAIFELIVTPDFFNNVLTLYSVSHRIKFIRFSCYKLVVTIERFRRSQ